MLLLDLLTILLNILAFVFMLGLVILLHELGHFIMAKRAGILCHEFAIGMGPILYSKKKGETTYSIRAIPIGGFVMMAGEELNDELVKVGQEIRVLLDGELNITHIILNKDDARYQEAMLIEVDHVDLKSKNGEALRINEYEVLPNAYYVMLKKELQIAPYDRSFESKTITQRFATIFAGPFMNFVLAFILFVFVAFIVGLPNQDTNELGQINPNLPAGEVLEVGDRIISIEGKPVETWSDLSRIMREEEGNRSISFVIDRNGTLLDFEISPVLSFYNAGFSSDINAPQELIIGSVGARSPADKAGLKVGDEIFSIDGVEMVIWNDVIQAMRNNPEGDDMSIIVIRDGVQLENPIIIGPFSESFLEGQGVNFIQAALGVSPTYEREFFGSFTYGVRATVGAMGMIFATIGALFSESRVGVGDLAGPIGIFTITAAVIQTGFVAFLSWMAILSVNLGIINLLPIPALDGGRLVFLGYEGITKRPVNKRVENALHLLMYVLLLTLFVFVSFNDILRLFNLR
ncbi:MAG: RIP metalloprotease RseP [Candidatus Izemoplasmataceae bacterium]